MKSEEYTTIICRRFCRFYKEDKEELTCGTYNFLVKNLTLKELISNARHIIPETDFSRDKELRGLVCKKCDFLLHGCDFREGLDAPPCGGYVIVEWLLRKTD